MMSVDRIRMFLKLIREAFTWGREIRTGGMAMQDCLRARCEYVATRLRWERRVSTDHPYVHRGEWYTQYFCSRCSGELTPGPTVGGTNQVCENCRLNYGCLPGAPYR